MVLTKQHKEKDNTISQEIIAKMLDGKRKSKQFDTDLLLHSIMTSVIAAFFANEGFSRDEAKLYLDSDTINDWINQAYDIAEKDLENYLNDLTP